MSQKALGLCGEKLVSPEGRRLIKHNLRGKSYKNVQTSKTAERFCDVMRCALTCNVGGQRSRREKSEERLRQQSGHPSSCAGMLREGVHARGPSLRPDSVKVIASPTVEVYHMNLALSSGVDQVSQIHSHSGVNFSATR